MAMIKLKRECCRIVKAKWGRLVQQAEFTATDVEAFGLNLSLKNWMTPALYFYLSSNKTNECHIKLLCDISL